MKIKRFISLVLAVLALLSLLIPGVSAEDAGGSGEAVPFVDLPPEGHWARAAILWAYERGVIAGVDETHFAPNEPVTRAQAAMMLWRYRMSYDPLPNKPPMPFTDVKPDDYYYTAVCLLWQKRAVVGVSETRFGPKGLCKRGQIAAMVNQYLPIMPSSTVEDEDPIPVKDARDFVDLKETDYYYWAIWSWKN